MTLIINPAERFLARARARRGQRLRRVAVDPREGRIARLLRALVALVAWILGPFIRADERRRGRSRLDAARFKRERRAARVAPAPTRYALWNVTRAAERWRRRWSRATWR